MTATTTLRGARLLAAGLALASAQARAEPVPPRPGLSLAFADEFDGDALGPAWSTCYETGACIHGPELQEYRPPADPAGTVRVGGGRLTLTASPAPVSVPGRPDIRYVSGLVSSHASTVIRHGYVEARIRIPSGRGLWPAFWLFQSAGPETYGEIDVMESLGHEPGKVYSTLHAGGTWKDRKILQVEPVATDFGAGSFADGFHVYAVDWGPETTRFLIDGRETGSFPSPPALDVPMHVILNLAVGGEWAGEPDDPLVFPGRMEVDWIRVWRPAAPAPDAPPEARPAPADGAAGPSGDAPDPAPRPAPPDRVP